MISRWRPGGEPGLVSERGTPGETHGTAANVSAAAWIHEGAKVFRDFASCLVAEDQGGSEGNADRINRMDRMK